MCSGLSFGLSTGTPVLVNAWLDTSLLKLVRSKRPAKELLNETGHSWS